MLIKGLSSSDRNIIKENLPIFNVQDIKRHFAQK